MGSPGGRRDGTDVTGQDCTFLGKRTKTPPGPVLQLSVPTLASKMASRKSAEGRQQAFERVVGRENAEGD
jgi:hypothetical protein